MKLRVTMVILTAGFLACMFQNCSQAKFIPSATGTYFTGEAPPAAAQASGNNGSPQDGGTAPASADPGSSSKTPPTSTDSGSPSNCDHSSENSLVECELSSPHLKIKLNQVLDADHSNDQSSRVCMSENACLKIINVYAADHKCNLDLGAATSPGSSAQCTNIFPGSKGTCHNAKVLTDEMVEDILNSMGK